MPFTGRPSRSKTLPATPIQSQVRLGSYRLADNPWGGAVISKANFPELVATGAGWVGCPAEGVAGITSTSMVEVKTAVGAVVGMNMISLVGVTVGVWVEVGVTAVAVGSSASCCGSWGGGKGFTADLGSLKITSITTTLARMASMVIRVSPFHRPSHLVCLESVSIIEESSWEIMGVFPVMAPESRYYSRSVWIPARLPAPCAAK